jgi:hypothetical protein
MTIGYTVRRSLFYLGLAIASLAIFSLIFAISMHVTLPFRWVTMAVFTGILLFTLVKIKRPYWKRRLFWLICTGVLVVHLAIFVPILRSYPGFRLVWWIPILTVEAAVFSVISDLLMLHYRPRND